jgi:hypothetical protein
MEVLKLYVLPIGTVIATNILFVISLPAVYRADNNRNLGFLNPVPYAYQLLLATVFVVYSFYLHDLVLFGSFIFGVVLSLYYILRTYPLATRRDQNHMLAAISGIYLS